LPRTLQPHHRSCMGGAWGLPTSGRPRPQFPWVPSSEPDPTLDGTGPHESREHRPLRTVSERSLPTMRPSNCRSRPQRASFCTPQPRQRDGTHFGSPTVESSLRQRQGTAEGRRLVWGNVHQRRPGSPAWALKPQLVARPDRPVDYDA
jgi:hypothetical protein